jgi:excisionase family DNA binding protein
MTDRPRDAWLSLDEAAARLGVARLRLREAIAAGVLRAQRDNRGFWRVQLEEGRELPREIAVVAPEKLIEALFDEIEELTGALDERKSEVERLDAVASRQQALLDRALALAEASSEPSRDVERLAALNARSQALVERSLASLEQREAALQQMSGMMDRALDTAAGLDAEVARQRKASERQRALLDRVFEIARASLERLGGETPRGGWFQRFRGRRTDGKG